MASPWHQQPPIDRPQERHIAIGTIPIVHTSLGHPIGWVAPQSMPAETDRLARMIEQTPAMYRALKHIIKELEQIPRERNEIALFNYLLDARAAVAGLEVCE